MKTKLILCVFVASWLIPIAATAQVTSKEVKFYSEAVQCYAKIYLPKGFTTDSKAPAVVVAPAPGDTAASVDKYAAQFAGRGIVAMAIDYRGWGKSGGFLYLAEPVRWDDRLRFSQHTAKVRIRRGRSIPDAQLLDIRNAISYLPGEPASIALASACGAPTSPAATPSCWRVSTSASKPRSRRRRRSTARRRRARR
jgi:hypothetical protein